MKNLCRWFVFCVIAGLLLFLPVESVQADVGPVLLINEVKAGVEKSIEFYNPSPNPVSIEGYSVLVYHMGADTLAAPYEFLSGTSIAGYGYVVLHLWDGTNSGNEVFLGYDESILWNSGGAVELYNDTDEALDFVRFNGSSKLPPAGTNWTGATPVISDTDNSLGRDKFSTDTDDGADWIEQTPTLGGENLAEKCYFLTISKTGSGAVPTAGVDHSDGCDPGYYHANEGITLTGALPDSGWGIGGWMGSDNDASRSASNTVTMPADDHAVSVTYLEIPLQVTLNTPADLAEVPVGPLNFTWQSVAEADRYTFEIRDMATNDVLAKLRYTAAARCSGGTCSIPSPMMLDPGAFKWHVVASNQGLSGEWSTYNRLYIVVDGPRLRSPGADAIVYGGRPTFKWYEEVGANAYRVQLFDSTMTEVGMWTTNPVCGDYCEFRLPFDLESDYGEYTWQVQTIFAEADSAWSDARSFTYTQLARTSQISPEDGAIWPDTTPEFQWVEITGATLYLFQVRLPDDTFVGNWLVSDATYCVDGGNCSWVIPDGVLEAGTSYKWHVRAKNGRNFGRWTAYRTITIESLPE